MNKLLAVTEAAKLIGVSAGTLRKWDNTGKFKAIRLGKHRRYQLDDIIAIVKGKLKID